MADITELSVGCRVKYIDVGSPYYGLKGTVVQFGHDGWVQVQIDNSDRRLLAHPMDLELMVDEVDIHQQYEKLRQEADDLHGEVDTLTAMVTTLTDEKTALEDRLSTFRNQVIGLYRRCMDITNADAMLRESMFIGGLNYICDIGGKK
jgi:predicted nuclease with TOPRIM domain